MSINLDPLIEASLPIKLHLATVVPTIFIGAAQIVLPKGTMLHRAMGYSFIGLIVATIVIGYFIRTLNPPGFSTPHYTSIIMLVAMGATIVSARMKNVYTHRICGLSLYATMIVTGLLALVPHRVLYQVFLGS